MYQSAHKHFDIHEIWNLTEKVVVARGAISVNSLVASLLKHFKYEKDFKDTVMELQAQIGPQQVL